MWHVSDNESSTLGDSFVATSTLSIKINDHQWAPNLFDVRFARTPSIEWATPAWSYHPYHYLRIVYLHY